MAAVRLDAVHGVFRKSHHVGEIRILNDQKRRHDLRDAGRVLPLVDVFLIKADSVIHVHQDRRFRLHLGTLGPSRYLIGFYGHIIGRRIRIRGLCRDVRILSVLHRDHRILAVVRFDIALHIFLRGRSFRQFRAARLLGIHRWRMIGIQTARGYGQDQQEQLYLIFLILLPFPHLPHLPHRCQRHPPHRKCPYPPLLSHCPR